jgi:uncharacterized integral membrane protein
MEVYMLGVALGAFAMALVALVRTMHLRRLLGRRGLAEASIKAAPADDAARTSVNHAGCRPRVLRLVRPTHRRGRSIVSTDWLLRVTPRACAATAVTIVVVTFAEQNTGVVRLDFLDWHLDGVPVAAAILAAAIVPASTVAALAFMERRRLRMTIRQLEHRLREAGDSRRRRDWSTRLQPTFARRAIESRAD